MNFSAFGSCDQCHPRLVAADLRLQTAPFGFANVGRVGHNRSHLAVAA